MVKVPIWLLFFLATISQATETIITVALPEISKNLNVSSNITKLLSSFYFFGFALGIFSLGRASDIYGRRIITLCGIIIYFISTLFCIFLTSITSLLFLRFLQAFGASVGSVLTQAIVRDVYKGYKLAYIYATIALILSCIPSIGIVLGGYIVEFYGWRFNFAVLAFNSLLLFTALFFYLPETNKYLNNDKVRFFNIVKQIITDKTVLLYALIIGCFNSMILGFYLQAPFIFITSLKFSPSLYGKLGIFLTIPAFIGNFINRYLLNKQVNNLKILKSGLYLSFISCTFLLFTSYFILAVGINNATIITVTIMVPVTLHILGQGLAVPPILRFALEKYYKVNGTAGSIFGTIYYLIVALTSYIISCLSTQNVMPFLTFFWSLSLIINIAFYIIQITDKDKYKEN